VVCYVDMWCAIVQHVVCNVDSVMLWCAMLTCGVQCGHVILWCAMWTV